jgi:LNS2 (Lipin/Ned1/Smp2)
MIYHQALALKPGVNTIEFCYHLVDKDKDDTIVSPNNSLSSKHTSPSNTATTAATSTSTDTAQIPLEVVKCNVYLWSQSARIVILHGVNGSNSGGSSAKSSQTSHQCYTQLHSTLVKNEFQILYIDNKRVPPSSLSTQYPSGPLLQSPSWLFGKQQKASKADQQQKDTALSTFALTALRGIRELFPSEINPFYAGKHNLISKLTTQCSILLSHVSNVICKLNFCLNTCTYCTVM